MKIFNRTIFIWVLWIILIKPGIISLQYPLLSNIWDAIKIILLLYVWATYFLKWKKFSKWIIATFVYCLYMIVNNFAKGIFESSDIINLLNIVSVVAIIEMSVNVNPKKNIKIITNCFAIYLFINFITMIIFPGGMYNNSVYSTNYFLGYDNYITIYILPAIILSFIYSKLAEKKFTKLQVFVVIISLLSVMISGVATALLTLFGVLIILGFRYLLRRKINLEFSLQLGYFINALFFCLVVVLRITNFLSGLVESVGKDVTFSTRTYAWDSAIYLISKRPITGYGHISLPFVGAQGWDLTATHAHNLYLTVLYFGGAIGLILFLYLFFLIYKQMKNHNREEIYMILSVGIFAILLSFQMEYLLLMYYFIIFTIAYHINLLNKDKKVTY